MSSEIKSEIFQINRKSDRVLRMKIAVGKVIVNVISVYAPQVGCTKEEKDDFLELTGSVMIQIPESGVV